MFENIKSIIVNPRMTNVILSRNIFPGHLLSDEQVISIQWKNRFGDKLDLTNPQTFNQKMQYLKIYDHNPLYTILADKIAVKKYVSDRIGADHIIPLMGIYDRFDDIDFSFLPKQFVIKCNHDSGGVVICKDKEKLNMKKIKKFFKYRMKHNYYWVQREWCYKDIKPKIFIEEYIINNNLINQEIGSLTDYKFYCFSSRVWCVLVATERFSVNGAKYAYYDREWNRLPFSSHKEISNENVPAPNNLNKMIEYSELLSNQLPFLRVDFYETNEKCLVGELTLYPGGGFLEFNPKEWDYNLGELIDLSKITH